jgi:toxin ParE1/3/4
LNVEWEPKAEADLTELFDYIAADDIEAAYRVRENIFNQTDMLAQFPHMGRPGRARGSRELVLVGTSYIAAYRIKNEAVMIMRILHGARRWPKRLR